MNFNPNDVAELSLFYRDQIENNFFKFWNKAVDRQSGGIFNCFNNTGTELVSRNKYTWSQGRFVWVWSKLYELTERGLLSLDKKGLRDDLEKTVAFLEKHIYMENGNCAFLMDENGSWIESIPGKGYDTSFYADCFVTLGFSAYARIFEDKHYAELALKTYKQIDKRIKEGNLRSEPYPIPKGYRFHAVPMIMLNTSEELALTLEKFGDARSEEIDRGSCGYMKQIMETFYDDEEGRVIETLGPNGAVLNDVLCRHINPGHAIEDMWFVMYLAKRKNRTDYIEKATRAVKSEIKIGWDGEFGGLFRFVDAKGGKPNGDGTVDV